MLLFCEQALATLRLRACLAQPEPRQEISVHVINRGNARLEVCGKVEDSAAFRALLGEAGDRVRMRVLAYCLMPNHHGDILR